MTELDREEKKVLESVEDGEWKSVKNLANEITRYQSYAQENLKNDKQVNIQLSANDLEALQLLAVDEGIPYQIFIASILHRYIVGHLVERKQNSDVA